jgi:hypothetical protein
MENWISKTSDEDIIDILKDPEISPNLLADLWTAGQTQKEFVEKDGVLESEPVNMSRILKWHRSGIAPNMVAKINSATNAVWQDNVPEHLQTKYVPFEKDPAIGSLVNKGDICLANERKGFPMCLNNNKIHFVGKEVRRFQWVPTEEQAQELAEGEV